jgi:hypothetical protein
MYLLALAAPLVLLALLFVLNKEEPHAKPSSKPPTEE